MRTVADEVFSIDTLAEHISLSETTYSSQEAINPVHFLWKHAEGPYGPSACIALRGGNNELLGRLLKQPRMFFSSPKKFFCGSVAIDLLVSPTSRHASSLIAITRQIKGHRDEVVLHTSNQTSDPIYRNLFKFPIQFTLVGLGVPLNLDGIFKSFFKSTRELEVINCLMYPWRFFLVGVSKLLMAIANVSFVKQPKKLEADALLSAFQNRVGCHFVRNLDFLKWRFIDGLLFNGDIRWISFKGKCVGYLVLNQVEVGGLKACVLMDIAISRELTLLEQISIKFLLVHQSIKFKRDVVFTLVNTRNKALKWLEGFPFFKIPDKLLPHSTPIFIHAPEKIFPFRLRNEMYVTLADLDYF